MEQHANVHHQRTKQAMKKLNEVVLQLSLSRNPSRRSRLQEAKIQKHIEEGLSSLLPSQLCVPNHPPYNEMILEAIGGLNEERGSSEESISSFIKLVHEDLPFAHPHVLNHHLRNLVKLEAIICTPKLLYKLPDVTPNSVDAQTKEIESIVVPLSVVLPEKEETLLLKGGLGRRGKKSEQVEVGYDDDDEETCAVPIDESWIPQQEDEVVGEEKEQPKRRGRPPKAKPIVIVKENEQPQRQGRGRLPKTKGTLVTKEGKTPQRRIGRPPKAKAKAMVVVKENEQQKLVIKEKMKSLRRCRGRPPKAK